MIQQIYITDYLSQAAVRPEETVRRVIACIPQLRRAAWQVMPFPPAHHLMQALGGAAHLTSASAAVAAVLRERQDWPQGQPALCLFPVHLHLQRDTFALQGMMPLTAEVYITLTQILQQHFAEEFAVHAEPGQQFWWIHPRKEVQAHAPWPQDYLYQQAIHWQPQGKHASLIRQWSNEIQMLLHQLSTSAQQAAWPESLNSLWFASIPPLPDWQHGWPIVYGQGAVSEGLHSSGLPHWSARSMQDVLGDSTVSEALMVVDTMEDVDWFALASALQKGVLTGLHMVLPFAERSVQMHYKKHMRWQFWRKTLTSEQLFQQLLSTLPAAQLPA